MRAYFIRVTKPGTDQVLRMYTSFTPSGATNGAALRVELDIPVSTYGNLAGNGRVKVYGVNFADIAAASDLNDADVTIYGGMAAGLPLANPRQAGILAKGKVWQCYGNRVGTETSLEMIIIAKEGSATDPANLSFNWTKGTTLEAAVRNVLGIAYPSATITGGFSPSLVYTEDQPFAYQTLQQLGRFALASSLAIIKTPGYLGAQIVATPAGFNLYDGTNQPRAKQISYLDLIGNPTWLEPGVIQFMCVMRADIIMGDIVSLPAGSNVINTAKNFRNTTAFSGDFQVSGLRHLGDSRQLSAESWVTVIDATAPGSKP